MDLVIWMMFTFGMLLFAGWIWLVIDDHRQARQRAEKQNDDVL